MSCTTTTSREKGILFKATVTLCSILLFSLLLLLALEGGIRFYYRNVLSTADGKSYFSLKSQKLFRKEINGYHLRGKPFKEISDKCYRVVVAGDSFTWGQGVYPAEKRFTERVESQLRKNINNSLIEVVNVGICGFNLKDHVKFLHFIDAINPDYVLYQWYVNDMVSNPDTSQFKPSHLVRNKKIHIWLWKNSALYYMLQRGYGTIQINKGLKKSYSQYLQDTLGDENGPAARKAREFLEKLIDHYQETNTDFGIVLFPTFSYPMDTYPLDFLHEQVLSVCRERKIQCLDLRQAYHDTPNQELWANVFDPHPGELAHEIAADEIINFFSPYWIKKAVSKKELRECREEN